MAVTTDSASNNGTFMKQLVLECQNRDLWHVSRDSKVNCFAHVMDLAVQSLMKHVVSSSNPETNDDDERVEDDESDASAAADLPLVSGNINIVTKVMKHKLYLNLLIYVT